GLFCSTPMVALSRNVGRKQAMEMLLLGDNINADKAVELGLVNRAVAGDQLATALADMTAILCAKSDITMTRGKQAFYEQIDLPIGAAYDHTINVMVENMMAADADEGIGAFIEKRKPNWQN
ncbi:MAG: enoyl-CoA hydratase-related protein, partial [Gammaproteobacteria bacterium]